MNNNINYIIFGIEQIRVLCYKKGQRSPSLRVSTMASYPINNIKSLLVNHNDVSLFSKLKRNLNIKPFYIYFC